MTDYNASNFVLETADICPHGGSSSACEWCGYRAQVGHLKAALAACQKERDSLLEDGVRVRQVGRTEWSEVHKCREGHLYLGSFASCPFCEKLTTATRERDDLLKASKYWSTQLEASMRDLSECQKERDRYRGALEDATNRLKGLQEELCWCIRKDGILTRECQHCEVLGRARDALKERE